MRAFAARLARGLGLAAWPAPLPTADLYLLAGFAGTDTQDLQRVGPNTWVAGAHVVVVRYVTDAELDLIGARTWRTLSYVVDDLIPQAATSLELPDDYRRRLAAFAAGPMQHLLARNPVIVAPSAAILAAFPQHQGQLLDPACLALIDGELPPPTPWGAEGGLEIAFLGTRSHAGSLPLIDRLAGRLARDLPRARLSLWFGAHLPREMTARANIVNRPALAWADYRTWRRAARFHVGLAPVQATAFATARSITKVMDHAGVGAVGVYSARAPLAGVVEDGRSGVLIDDDTGDAWAEAIVALAGDPQRAMEIAAGGQALARVRGAPERVARFWRERWGV